MLLRATFLVVAAGLSFECSCPARTAVSVRVIDARSAKPLKDRQVWVQFYPQASQKIQRITNMSALDGRADFRLPEPPPEAIYVSLTRDDLSCGGVTEIKLNQDAGDLYDVVSGMECRIRQGCTFRATILPLSSFSRCAHGIVGSCVKTVSHFSGIACA